jgi:UDP-N-acetyl-D-mannosaminuronate dehydrogenase
VAYKPDVADVRESPAIEIIDGLAQSGARVSFTDPLVERLRTRAGVLVSSPDGGEWDLVVLIHPNGASYAGSPVLDTTFRRNQ